MPLWPTLSLQNIPKYKFFLSYNTFTDDSYKYFPPCRGSILKKSVTAFTCSQGSSVSFPSSKMSLNISTASNDGATKGGSKFSCDLAVVTRKRVTANAMYIAKVFVFMAPSIYPNWAELYSNSQLQKEILASLRLVLVM